MSDHQFVACTDNQFICQACGSHKGNHTFEYVPPWTKGPWKVTFPCGDIPHAAFIESAEGRHIVCVGEQHANALLMSLSPDLADLILDMDALGREHGHLCECEYCNLFARAKTLAGRLPK